MCRACLSWTSCVAASRWLAGEENVQGGADDFCRCRWPDGLKGNALVLTRRRRVLESVKQKGKKKRCSGFGCRTPADSLDARRLSVFILSDESKTHTQIYVCLRESVSWVKADDVGHPASRGALTRSSHSLLIPEFIVWLVCAG